MRTKVGAIAAVWAVLLCAPALTLAEGEALSQMSSLEQRIMALEDRLAASEATVAAQKQLIKSTNAAVGSITPATDFWSQVTIGGHVTASYVYNFKNPDFSDPGNTDSFQPGGQPYYLFNTNHNSFAFDAFKLEIGKAADQPGTAGFQVDLLYGENAGILGSGLPTNFLNINAVPPASEGFVYDSVSRDPSDVGFFMQQAYVSWMSNSGVRVDLGKWEALLGYEVLDSPENPNITRGWLFTYGVPFFHTGLLLNGNLTEEIDWSIGVVNGFDNSFDFNDNKGVTGRVRYVFENFTLQGGAFVGSERSRVAVDTPAGVRVGDNNDPIQIYDVHATYDPMEEVHLWTEWVYGREDFDSQNCQPFPCASPTDMKWYGVSTGVKYTFDEKTYLALRGEWFRDDGGSRLLSNLGTVAPPDFANHIDVYSGTVTLGYMLTPRLLARAEYRYDKFDSRSDGDADTFPKHNLGFDDQSNVGIVEVNYLFD